MFARPASESNTFGHNWHSPITPTAGPVMHPLAQLSSEINQVVCPSLIERVAEGRFCFFCMGGTHHDSGIVAQ